MSATTCSDRSGARKGAAPPCDIRRVGEGDRAEWLRLRRSLWPGLDDTVHAREMGDYAARGADAAVFVADRGGGRLGGFIEVSTRDRIEVSFPDPVAYVEGWYVDPDLRRRGAGRRLMAQAESWARARGLRQVGSDTDVANADSVRAHAALGFRETIRLVHFLKDLGPRRRQAGPPEPAAGGVWQTPPPTGYNAPREASPADRDPALPRRVPHPEPSACPQPRPAKPPRSGRIG